MKKFLLGTVALVALGATAPALAADLPARTYTKAPVYAAPIYNWTGFYIGGHIGGVFSSDNNFGGLTTGNNSDGRFLGGLQGGYGFSDNNDTLTLGGIPTPFALSSGHRDGYTIGAGLEYMFTQNWSGKIEYQYYNFGNSSFVTPVALAPFGNFRTDDHVVKAGINYRFNWGGPVVAKY